MTVIYHGMVYTVRGKIPGFVEQTAVGNLDNVGKTQQVIATDRGVSRPPGGP